MPVSLPSYELQHCSWYIAQNIKKRLADKRYLIEERKAIINLIWAYIQSSSEVKLDENRAALTKSMKANERDFLTKYWYPRERQFVYIYTKIAPNLGCNSIQRAESTYPVTTTLLNHQLLFIEAATRLAKGIRIKIRDLKKKESKSYSAIPRI